MRGENSPGNGTIVDLFCGCGGFSLGAELAGFQSLSAIDIDPTLQSGYRRNFPRSKVVQASVADIGIADWQMLLGNRRPDGVIGGPPCQGFSRIGKRREDDPRNTLVHEFYRHVKLLSPKFFIMENVEGILDADMLDVLMTAISTVSNKYRIIGPVIINAADYGAATKRKRVLVIGYDPSEIDIMTEQDFLPSTLNRNVTVRDAIGDLPSPRPAVQKADDFEWGAYSKIASPLSDYARRLRASPPSGLGWQEAVEKQKNGFVSGLAATVHSDAVARRYESTPGGKAEPITKSYRLEWDGQCPTLRAGTGADKGSFQAVRPLHPGEGRVITVREGARMQGFPDWFVFHPTKWHSFRMIGNSISPIVSQALLTAIAQKLQLALAA